jgi:hypothetical protein
MTAQDVINFAAKEANIMASGESLNSDEYTDCLTALNAMLAAWNLEQITIYVVVNYQHALTASTGTYTIGTGGTLNTTRPVKIESAGVIQSNGLRDTLKLIGSAEWAAIGEKGTVAVRPLVLFNDNQYPLASLNIYPKPSGTPMLDLWMWEELAPYVALTDTFDLPPGYFQAVYYNLAIHLAVMFGKPISEGLKGEAVGTKAKIAAMNLSNFAASEAPPPQQAQQ